MDQSRESTHIFSIPSSLGLEIHQDAQKGRHILTTRSFKAGELVLAQAPYAAVLHDAQVPVRCDHCYLIKPDLQQCGRSHFARYCCRAHQKAAWDSGYKQECTALTSLPPHKKPTPTMRLVARCAWKAAREPQQTGQKDAGAGAMRVAEYSSWPAPGGTWAHVGCLLDHWHRAQPHMRVMYAQVAVAAREYALAGMAAAQPCTSKPTSPHADPQDRQQQQTARATALGANPGQTSQTNAHITADASSSAESTTSSSFEPDGLPSVRALARLVAQLACNSHTICDEELRPVGMGLYPLAAMANHSDDPSCLQSFLGSVMCFRAMRDLPPGSEVTIPYVDLGTTRQVRREALWDQYHYDQHASALLNGPSTNTYNNVEPQGLQHCMAQASADHSVPSSASDLDRIDGVVGEGSGSGAVEVQGEQPSTTHPSMIGPAVDVLRPAPLSMHRWSPDGGWIEQPAPGAAATSATDTVSSSNGVQGTSTSDSAQVDALHVCLRLYAAFEGKPPWPCDARDQKLTEIWIQSEAGAYVLLPGGLQARLSEDGALKDIQMFDGMFEEESPSPTVKHVVCDVDCWGTWAGHAHPRPQQTQSGLTTTAGATGNAQGRIESVAEQIGLEPPGQQRADGLCSDVQPVDQAQATAAQGRGTTVPCDKPGPDGSQQGDGAQFSCARVLALHVTGMVGAVRKAEALRASGNHAAAMQALTAALAHADGMRAPRPPHGTWSACGSGQQEPHGPVVIRLGDMHLLLKQLLEVFLLTAIESGNAWTEALHTAQKLQPIYEMVHCRTSPSRALHDAMVAKLAALCGTPADALSAAERALEALAITHAGGAWGAAGGAVCEEVARMRWQAKQDLAG